MENTYEYNIDAVNVRITKLQFSKFTSGDFPLTNKRDDDMLLLIINTDPRQNIKEITLKIGVNRLKKARYLNRLDLVP